MEQLILAALVILSLSAGRALAGSYSHAAAANNRRAVVKR